MAVVDLTLPHHRYQIRIEPGLLGQLGSLLRPIVPHGRAALIVDAAVADDHGRTAEASLREGGYELIKAVMNSGEQHKSLQTVSLFYEQFLEARFERQSPVVALGGGVVGDTAGFVAATLLRGVPFVQCPTTLLCMVDAGVGGKVGVNTRQGKNLVGAFHQPALVVVDTDTLATLPPRELKCGLAECVKHAVICDASLFDWIDDRLDAILKLDSAVMVELVERNVRIKAEVVMADEKEQGRRALLNFGHTFAHAIEKTQTYDSKVGFHHGEAVALGMVAAARLAATNGMCDADVPRRLSALLNRIGLPTAAPLAPTDTLMDAMRSDKKARDGRLHLVLPRGIGDAVVEPAPSDAAIEQAWESVRG
jgi:3-dehydroquinate synthase